MVIVKADAPGAARATVLTLAGEWQWKAWDNFLYSVATGEPGLRRAFGLSLFDYLAANPDVAAAHVNPLTHFLQFGSHEGRSAFADGMFG